MLRAYVGNTIRVPNGIAEDVLAAAETHVNERTPPILPGWLGGVDYITLLVMPDFNIHVGTTRNILRIAAHH
jgi:hypothetical protein